MQSIAMQSRSAAASVSPARTAAPTIKRESANKKAVATFDSVEMASDGGLSTQLERDKTVGRSSSMSEVERGVLSVNLAAQKFSPVAAAQSMQEDMHDDMEDEDDESMVQQIPQMGQSPASFYRSATGQSPYASDDGSMMVSPGDSEMSSPTSSPCAPSPTAEERREAAERDRSLVDQLVQPISHPISQEWHASPGGPTAWCVASPRSGLIWGFSDTAFLVFAGNTLARRSKGRCPRSRRRPS